MKKVLSILCCLSILLGCIFSMFTVSATATDSIADQIKAIFDEYVISKGNNVASDTMLDCINKRIAPYSVSLASSDDYFIYHAEDGVYDESDSTYPLNIAGHNGYMSAILQISDGDTVIGSVGAVATIPYKTENLGTLTSDVYSADNTNFTTTDGNITGYSGSAEKIVIPASFSGTINLKDCAGKDNVKVVIIGDKNTNAKIAIAAYSFSGWANLRAVVLPGRIHGSIGDYAFAENGNLKYVWLPAGVNGSSGSGYGPIQAGAFCHNPVLSTAYHRIAAGEDTLPSAQYMGIVFEATAIRDYYLPKWFQYGNGGSQASTFGNLPSYSEGTTVVMTNTQNGTATLARAAVLAKVEADNYSYTATDTADTVKAAMVAGYSAKNANLTADWNNTFAKSGDYAIGELTISDGTNSIPVDFSRGDGFSGVIAINIADYELTPEFNKDVYEYSLTVPNEVTALSINVVVGDNATVGTITGNSLVVGANVVTIPVTVGDETLEYVINVTRLEEEKSEYRDIVIDTVNEYVHKNGNDSTSDGLLVAVNRAIAPEIATIDDGNFYIKHAVDAVEDKCTTAPLDIPGTDGYVSAIFTIGTEKIGAVATIAHEVEILDITDSDVAYYDGHSTNGFSSEGFVLDSTKGDNYIVDYTGTAKKLVFTRYATLDLSNASCKDQIKVVMLGECSAPNNGNANDTGNGLVNLADNCFNGWENLRAVTFWKTRYSGTHGATVFANCSNLKYVRLPHGFYGSDIWGSLSSVPEGTFKNCTSLENLYDAHVGVNYLGCGIYYREAFAGTAIWEVNLQSYVYAQSGASWSEIVTRADGKAVTFYTANDLKNASFARAAALAQAKADALAEDVTADNADTVKASIVAGFESLTYDGTNKWSTTDYTAIWSSDYSYLTLKYNDQSIAVMVDYKLQLDGDMNGDISVDAQDLIILRKILLGSDDETETADVNCDGVVDIRDLIRLKKIISGWVETVSTIPNVIKRLEEDKELTIGYLGGSITLGTSAGRTSYENGAFGEDTGDYSRSWVNQTSAWFSEQYPDAEITTVNAGVSDTQTNMALFRLEETLMNTNGHDMPDLVFVEFTNNDWSVGIHQTANDLQRQVESLFRNIYALNPNAQIIVLITSRSSSESHYDIMAEYYDIPVIDVGDKMAELMTARGYTNESAGNYYYTVDDLHPSIYGYDVYSQEIQGYLATQLVGLKAYDKYINYEERMPEAKWDLLIDNPEILLPENLEYTSGTIIDTPFALSMFGTDATTVSKVNMSDKMLHLTEDTSVTFEIEGNTLGLLLQMHSGSDVVIDYIVDGSSTHVMWGEEVSYAYRITDSSLAFQRYEHPMSFILEHMLGEGTHTVTLNFTIPEGQVVDIGGVLYNAESNVG